MPVQKFNARHTLFAKLLESKSAGVRQNAADTIRKAQKHVSRAEEIVSHSMAIVERAEKILDQIGRLRENRAGSNNRRDRT